MGQYATAPNQNAWALTTKSWLCPRPRPRPTSTALGPGELEAWTAFLHFSRPGNSFCSGCLPPPPSASGTALNLRHWAMSQAWPRLLAPLPKHSRERTSESLGVAGICSPYGRPVGTLVPNLPCKKIKKGKRKKTEVGGRLLPPSLPAAAGQDHEAQFLWPRGGRDLRIACWLGFLSSLPFPLLLLLGL